MHSFDNIIEINTRIVQFLPSEARSFLIERNTIRYSLILSTFFPPGGKDKWRAITKSMSFIKKKETKK